MIAWLAKRARPFARDRRGAVAIEFAFILPVMLLFSFGILEVSLCMASLVTLEGGLKQASRFGITSSLPSDADVAKVAQYIPSAFSGKDNRTKMIMAILNQSTLDLIDLNTATISTKSLTSFSDASNGEPFVDKNGDGIWEAGEPFSDTNCNNTRDGPGSSGGGAGAAGMVGGSNDIVIYTVNYNWKILTPLVGRFLGNPDPKNPGKFIIPMSAQMVVKNEPSVSGSSFCE